MPGIPLAQLSLLRLTHISTHLLELPKSTSNAICPNVDSCIAPSPAPTISPDSLPVPFLRTWHLICPVPQARSLRHSSMPSSPSPLDITSRIYLNWSISLLSQSPPQSKPPGSLACNKYRNFSTHPLDLNLMNPLSAQQPK